MGRKGSGLHNGVAKMPTPDPAFDWNDVRYLLAIARHGGTLAAGRALGVNSSTVQRRLAELERGLGRPLVHRATEGYRLTAFGEQLLPYAERLERAALDLAQQVADLERDISGVVRVTCPDPIFYRFTGSPLLERFRTRYPAIKIEFIMSDAYLDLRQGQADVALRAGTDDDSLVGREIGASSWAIYASKSYLGERGQPKDMQAMAAHDWVWLDESKAQHTTSRWLAQAVPAARFAARSSNMLGVVHSAKTGVGLAPLPVMLGDPEADLVRVLGPIPELARTWHLLTTRELRQTPRVAALFDFLVEDIAALRALLI
jgi:DNA-binding transcriptional LysR family regulator